MIHLTLASSNRHKADEFAKLLDPALFEIVSAPEKLDVEENGDSFYENAQIKAEKYFEYYNSPIIADDSGLVVEALPDELGIHSARFGGGNLTDEEKCHLLLRRLEGIQNRKAYFVCVISLILSKDEMFFFEGRLEGRIAHQIMGNGGFGYDPIFIPDKLNEEKTVAMVYDWKMDHSHRAAASHGVNKFFKERICQTKEY